jgi:hypothetical protein
MSIYHDNGVGKPERKFVSMNGKEAVYDGDSGKLLFDPRFVKLRIGIIVHFFFLILTSQIHADIQLLHTAQAE